MAQYRTLMDTNLDGLWIDHSDAHDDDDDDDDDDNDDELFLWHGWLMKGIKPYFLPGPLSEILIIANLWHAASRIWTCAEPEFRLSWMKLCSSNNHYTMAFLNLPGCFSVATGIE